MDAAYTLEALKDARELIETAIKSIESGHNSEEMEEVFYGSISSAYFRMNLAWNALGYSDMSSIEIDSKKLQELTRFPPSLLSIE